MRQPALLGLGVLCLAACAGRPGQAPVYAEPAPGMAGVEAAAERPTPTAPKGPAATAAPVLSTAVLPSLELTATLLTASPLLQRPQRGAAVLKTLPAGTVAALLGDLDNAEGQWLSVAIDGVQGWIRAAEARR